MSMNPSDLSVSNDSSQQSFFQRNKWTIIGGGVALLGGAAYFILKSRSSGSSGSAANTAQPVYVTPTPSSFAGSGSSGSGSGASEATLLAQEQAAFDQSLLNQLQSTTGSTTTTTSQNQNPSSNYVPSSGTNASAPQQVISQTTGLPIAGATVQNGQTYIDGVPAQITNPAAAGFNPYQPLTAAQAKLAYNNDLQALVKAGYSLTNARQLATAASSNRIS